MIGTILPLNALVLHSPEGKPMADNPNTDPALAPSSDSPAQNRAKLRFGRAAIWVGVGIAIFAFVFYVGIGVYGGYHAAG
jgi:hypothetical protein